MFEFDHERLDCYQLALGVARELSSVKFPRGDADLRDQAVRAARSVVLNIAEGRARGGGAQRNHYRIALGSAAEVCAALDLVALESREDLQNCLRRVGAMLAKISR